MENPLYVVQMTADIVLLKRNHLVVGWLDEFDFFFLNCFCVVVVQKLKQFQFHSPFEVPVSKKNQPNKQMP